MLAFRRGASCLVRAALPHRARSVPRPGCFGLHSTAVARQTRPPDDRETRSRQLDAPRAPAAQQQPTPVDIPLNAPGPGGVDPAPNAATGSIASPLPFPLPPPFDALLTTLIGLSVVFVGGVAYITWYKKHVLDKIERAFAAGYDPALDLANVRDKAADELEPHLRRAEQDMIDKIISGRERGRYFLILGSKGTGKTTMIIDAMREIDAEGVAIMDCHSDLEVFRERLGKAIDFSYFEDSQMGLFQRRDPREGGAGLDVERALNKLEKVGLRSARRTGRPLILVFNNVHLLDNTDDGRSLLLQLQQRAESWAESGIFTLVFSSDDFWPFMALRRTANRMHTLHISDLRAGEATAALHRLRSRHSGAESSANDRAQARAVLTLAGGRLSTLNRVAHAPDMLAAAHELVALEKAWLLSRTGLIPDCDDDVMDEQKWASCSWLLLREMVRERVAQETALAARQKAGTAAPDEDLATLPLPAIPYWRCRQIMTRADFFEELDRSNIISIDIHHNVRPDSMLILQAAREVVGEDGFDDMLQNVIDRVSEIESLHRTAELTLKNSWFKWPW